MKAGDSTDGSAAIYEPIEPTLTGQFRLAMEASPVGMILAEATGQIIQVNTEIASLMDMQTRLLPPGEARHAL